MAIDWMLIWHIIVIGNALFAIITVFRQPRDIAATWAWLLVLVFLPLLGFIIYAFFGRKLPKSKFFRLKGSVKKHVKHELNEEKAMLKKPKDADTLSKKIAWESANMVRMFMNSDTSPLYDNNKIDVFTNGDKLMDQMFEDIKNAKSSINLEFYTFYADKIGKKVLAALVKKAKEGVDVRVIYDSWGSMGTTQRFFKPLFEAGGHAYPFLHTHSNFFDFRVNFRDHHKILVIDGEHGYVGGFNIGDQYMGWSKKFGNWQDCSIRIHGNAIYGLQSQFILDWNATDGKLQINPNNPEMIKKYYPIIHTDGEAVMQIVSSGPDTSMEQIKIGYIKMIEMAKHKVQITTPYLIPDPSVLDALKIASMSGVDVQIIVPDMPDHPFVYRATQYYARQLTKLGVKVYYYNNGFMHAKTIVVDDKIVSVGSANMDYRSFKLNFEINSFTYDEEFGKRMGKIFEEDLKKSTLQTTKMFESESWWLNFKQHFSRLLSPIL
ncbi:cardiolipin synthase [Fructilactobacillus fructivorans]|uniref:Cardiolipin synthase n=1 Tax=Fructilactobacillus fructivorans TaxID=1614 RepID=A0AAE6P2Q5_9LACO|nr:cardiolipin synthase [Fructilactobacillus fructivorans]KRK56921.1 Cardiolipin synthase [Fructilactobacillus fructivorans]KRN13201.1 Cardiolipin synthase [Fructilactobacillus fructivorans]KRN41214.1 Cardiolipin synthase [Fructilactobacillus fructivorans]KRN43029.1 Cardiolipin synthase [Fructilactobacillus fructivorans]QFX93228.1 cardiolipin synthase [Fructilactobacillus fructivorans]